MSKTTTTTMHKITGENSSNDITLGSSSNTGNEMTSATNRSINGNYLSKNSARSALMRGVYLVNDAVKSTIGPSGHDALLGAYEWPYSIATNDGASIAERITSSDPYEQMGVRLMQESIGRANKESGDGSTTTCVITAAILEEGMRHAHANPRFKEELNAILPTVLEKLDSLTEEVTIDDVWKVAAVSAQDEEMGKMIGEIYTQIGKDGVIDWDNSHSEDTSYIIRDGVELKNVTFAHRSLINADAKGPVNDPRLGDRIIINNPYILITAEKINTAQQLNPYVDSLMRQGINELVVFCDEIEPIALAEIEAVSLGFNLRNPGERIKPFKIVVLRAPTLWKDWIYEDFSLMTGATVFGVGQSASFKGGSSLSWLGMCDKIVARRGGTDIIGTKDIRTHIETLKEASHDYRDFEKRVEWLNSKTATVKMGARSEVELSNKRLKFDDARHAAKLALHGGVVAGGGFALKDIAETLPLDTIGGVIMRAALKAPYKQISANMERELTEKDIVDVKDPSSVVKNAVRAAVSVAGTVLDCETLLPLAHEQKYQ